MIAVTLMWSIAGVVTRQLDTARSFEVTFWRSLFNAATLLPLLLVLRGPRVLARSLREGGRVLWTSALCWCVMFTAFMLAITLTTVANVLVTMATAPLLTALVARFALGHRLAARTWTAIVLAGLGIAWMYAGEVRGADARQWLGTGVAVCVPIAAAINWTLIQSLRGHRDGPSTSTSTPAPDMLAAVLLGALLSALATLPWALPFAASTHDLALLAMLGAFQLAVPCLLAVRVARVLSAPEVALLSLLEVVFGVAWAWLGANEVPSSAVLGGGALVLLALVGNEALTLRRSAVRR